MTSNAHEPFALPLSLISERRSRNVFAPMKFPSVELVAVLVGIESGESSVMYQLWRRRPNFSSPSLPHLRTVEGPGAAAGFGAGRL
jgi:hypothetical protein